MLALPVLLELLHALRVHERRAADRAVRGGHRLALGLALRAAAGLALFTLFGGVALLGLLFPGGGKYSMNNSASVIASVIERPRRMCSVVKQRRLVSLMPRGECD